MSGFGHRLQQKQLLVAKDVQLKSITSAVEVKVGEVKTEVQAEFRGYSAVLQAQGGSGGASTAAVKTAVKTALADRADEELRERNVVVFGLEEEAEEILSERVDEIFDELNVKPRFEAKRVGTKKPDDLKRPVLIVMKSAAVAREVVAKASKLRESDKFRGVFISPDRTMEQRIAQRDLVAELKRRRVDEPNKKHYIHAGKVKSLEGT